jgi:hypothetical protein
MELVSVNLKRSFQARELYKRVSLYVGFVERVYLLREAAVAADTTFDPPSQARMAL